MKLLPSRYAAAFAALFLIFAGSGQAKAAGDYMAATAISGVPVLWVYTPTTNQLKLCFPTNTNTLGCTSAIAAFSKTPASADSLQYRVSGNGSTNGSLWVIDETTAVDTLCGGTVTNGILKISCVQGSGIK